MMKTKLEKENKVETFKSIAISILNKTELPRNNESIKDMIGLGTIKAISSAGANNNYYEFTEEGKLLYDKIRYN